MKNSIHRLICLALALCLPLTIQFTASATQPLYAPDGRTVHVSRAARESYLAQGWYDEPVLTLYAPDGRTEVVPAAQAELYTAAGWYPVPVTTLYAPDGRTAVVPQEEVDSHTALGWYPYPVVTLYAPDGRTLVVPQEEVEAHTAVGWYTVPFLTVYGTEGRSLVISQDQLEQYEAWNWSTQPVTVTATDKEGIMNAASLLPMKTNDPDLDAKVDQIFAQILTDDMTTYEKVLACYDYLLYNTTYAQNPSRPTGRYVEKNDATVVNDAKSLFDTGTGVCVDYSAAFLVMTRRIGLDCVIYHGSTTARGGGFLNHFWNVISFGGVEYVFDAQVDDNIAAKTDGVQRYYRWFKTLRGEVASNYKGNTERAFGGFALRQ